MSGKYIRFLIFPSRCRPNSCGKKRRKVGSKLKNGRDHDYDVGGQHLSIDLISRPFSELNILYASILVRCLK
jgi:hypothetical protein